MKSSYNNIIDYNDIFKTIVFLNKSKLIVEFGILEGCSLMSFVNNCNIDTIIHAYDIFDDFNGNRASKDIITKFKQYPNVKIEYGDFYKKLNEYENETIDLLHIDIANDGNVYKYAINNYLCKIKKNGIIIFEGGSDERDNVYWMKKYNKEKIAPYVEYLKMNNYNILTIGNFPSITILKK